MEGIQKWLDKNGRGCQDEQKHIRAGTGEKIYWHYGYMVALMDVLRFLGRSITAHLAVGAPQFPRGHFAPQIELQQPLNSCYGHVAS